jgi:hypothetical protein
MNLFEFFDKLNKELSLASADQVLICFDNLYYNTGDIGRRGNDIILHVGSIWKRTIGKEYAAKDLKIGDVITLPCSKDSIFMQMKVVRIDEHLGHVVCVRPFVADSGFLNSEIFIAHINSEAKYILLGEKQ